MPRGRAQGDRRRGARHLNEAAEFAQHDPEPDPPNSRRMCSSDRSRGCVAKQLRLRSSFRPRVSHADPSIDAGAVAHDGAGQARQWLKKEGDKVKSGDVIAEIETDKATMEVEAVDEGVLAKILVPRGHRGRRGQHADRGDRGRRAKMRPPLRSRQPPPKLNGEAPPSRKRRGPKAPRRAGSESRAEAPAAPLAPAAPQAPSFGRARGARRHRDGDDDRARGPARRHGRGDAPRRRRLPDGRGGRRVSGRLQGQPGPAAGVRRAARRSTRRSPSTASPGSASARRLPGSSRSSSS